MLIAAALGSCAYQPGEPLDPGFGAYAGHRERLPGSFAVLVDDARMAGMFRVDGSLCSAYAYPIDARTAFSNTVLETLDELAEGLKRVDSPPAADQLEALGQRGLIQVRGEGLNIGLSVAPGFPAAEMVAKVTLTAGLQIDGPEVQPFGGTVSAEGESTVDVGGACGGATAAIGAAAEEALGNFGRALGERVAEMARAQKAPAPSPAVQAEDDSPPAPAQEPSQPVPAAGDLAEGPAAVDAPASEAVAPTASVMPAVIDPGAGQPTPEAGPELAAAPVGGEPGGEPLEEGSPQPDHPGAADDAGDAEAGDTEETLYCVVFAKTVQDRVDEFAGMAGEDVVRELQEVRRALVRRLLAEMTLAEIGEGLDPPTAEVEARYGGGEPSRDEFARDLARCRALAPS